MFISSDNADRFLKLASTRGCTVSTMVLSATRGLVLFRVIREGIGFNTEAQCHRHVAPTGDKDAHPRTRRRADRRSGDGTENRLTTRAALASMRVKAWLQQLTVHLIRKSSIPVNYRVARRPCGRPALSELGVKVSLHPAQALRTPL